MSKTIITVQHTESEHRLNGHAGAWGNWSLTEKGRQQTGLQSANKKIVWK